MVRTVTPPPAKYGSPVQLLLLALCSGVLLLMVSWAEVGRGAASREAGEEVEGGRRDAGGRGTRAGGAEGEFVYSERTGRTRADEEFFYRELGRGDGSTAILFLHGMRFTSADWLEPVDLMGEIATRAGVSRAIAIDMPSFGKSPALPDRSAGARAAFVGGAIEALQGQRGPARWIIVSPSMSGSWSLPFLHQVAEESPVVGFIPVAIVLPRQPYDVTLDVRTLAVFGEDDIKLVADEPRLDEFYGNWKLLSIPDADHAAYLDQPEAFVDAVVPFIRDVLSSVT